MEKTPHILVADDYHHMRLAVQQVLTEMALHNVHPANTGSMALQILQSVPVTLVIADWNMPGMTGFELLQWCRQDPHYRNVPFVLLTAEASHDYLQQAIQAGVTDYLVKPFTASTLRSRLQKLLVSETAPAKPLSHVKIINTPPSPPSSLIGMAATVEEKIARSSVLIVDDVPTNIEVIAGILSDTYAIKVAISGKRALEVAASASPPSIILLDVMMPEMDGYEVCRRLKANPATRDIPIIFLTAKDQADDVVDGLDLGAVDYVTKPANPDILRARIRSHLRLAHALHDLRNQNLTLAENARLREDIERITQHDLKNPLSAITQATDALLEDAALSEGQRSRLGIVEGAARHALQVVNLSLTLYKIENGDYHLQASRIDLARIAQSVTEQMRIQFAWKPVDVKLQAPDMMWAAGDASLCRSVIDNLLKNAIEAAPDDSVVTVMLAVAEGDCQLKIHNIGVVPAAIRATFFNKYVTHGKADGNGIGTYSARLLAEAQGGRIEMEADDAQNSTCLTVFLPLA